ncbi:MAG: exonuclease SbcCD subunit D [Candidatus Hermodarchaeota archaeon]
MSLRNSFINKFGRNFVFKQTFQDCVKFIHASDIHLGAAQYRNEYRADDFIQAFQEILELAIIHHVDFVLLGGDVFTSLEILPGKLTKIINLLRDFRGFTQSSISIISIEGNHDIRKFSRGVRFERRGQSWLKLLNSLGLIILLDADLEAPLEQIFKPYNTKERKGGKIQIKNVVVYGTRYLGEKPIQQLSKIRKAITKDNGLFNILIQHFGIEGQMQNVPGINLMELQYLKHRLDYLALGHYHKQFILEDWVYNPGSSEAACAMDHSFKRGVFLVEVSNEIENFTKHVKILHLNNRRYVWKTIHLNFEVRKQDDLELIIIDKLGALLRNQDEEIHPSNPLMPILYLVVKGVKPSFKVREKDLREKIFNNLPILDVKLYQKFNESLKTLDKYILS